LHGHFENPWTHRKYERVWIFVIGDFFAISHQILFYFILHSVVHDYLEVIKEPIDLSTIEKRIRQDNHYKSRKMLFADLMLMVNNCKLYNDENSTYVQCAVNLEKYLGRLFHDVVSPSGKSA